MIDVADLHHEEATYEEESPHGEPETPPSSGYIRSRSPSQDPLPPRDLYWICAALYSYTFGLVLLRLQAKKVERPSKRLVKKSPCIKAIFLISLIFLQQVQPVATLMTVAPLSKQGQRHSDPGTHSILPPPGNTCAIWDHESCIQRTPQGDHMINWLTGQPNFKARSADIWRWLNGSTDNCAVQTVTLPRSGTVCSPILPISSENSPITIELDRLVPKQATCRTKQVDVTPGSSSHRDDPRLRKLILDNHVDDLDDLAMPWDYHDAPPLCELPGLFPGLPQRLLQTSDATDYDSIEIYTDGSYDGGATCQSGATWAMSICGKPNHSSHIHLIDWYGDFVIDDPLDNQWVGALRQHIREAEASALIWTAFYLAAHFSCLPATVYSDALAVLNVAKGRWAARPTEHIGIRLRAIYQMLECAKGPNDLICRHVKSHSGVFGNELADAVANALRNGDLCPRPPPRHYAWWLQGDPPKLMRAHILIDVDVRADLPVMEESNWIYGPPCSPECPTAWLDIAQHSPQDDVVRLKIGTYNVNTLCYVGATSILRHQCHQAGLHLIGLQETRTTDTVTYDTDYVRYIGAAVQGNGGVELWISTTMERATSSELMRQSSLQSRRFSSWMWYLEESPHYVLWRMPHTGVIQRRTFSDNFYMNITETASS